jgi:hypothetical protein
MNNQKWDKEYSTQYLKEVDFLTDKGFRWSFAKTNDYGVRIYKYTKTKALFQALSEFYK